jgi:ABC-type uncharacterized transport system permease subunit
MPDREGRPRQSRPRRHAGDGRDERLCRISYLTGSPWLGVLAAGVVALLLGCAARSVCSLPRVNDIAFGIALMLLGTGLAFYLGKPLIEPHRAGAAVDRFRQVERLAATARALHINPLFVIGVVLAPAAVGLRTTRWGMTMRTCRRSAPTPRARWVIRHAHPLRATAIGGFSPASAARSCRCSIPAAGTKGFPAARALMAVALVIFARWQPLRACGPRCCSAAPARSDPRCRVGVTSGYHLFNAAPYMLTLAIMIINCRRPHACRRAGRTEPDALIPFTLSACRCQPEESNTTNRFIDAKPYPWPYDGDLRPQNTALVIIDMQTDFCGVGGYVDKMGYDLSLTRAPIEPIKRCSPRCAPGLHDHPHARGPSPDLSDLPANKRWRSARRSAPGIGDDGPCGRILVRGEPGWEIIRTRAAAGRADHRQARQGLVLRHRSRTDPAHARHREHLC